MLKIMQLLLNMDNVGFDVENNIECTPLFYAAEKGSEGVVRALLAKGASILRFFTSLDLLLNDS